MEKFIIQGGVPLSGEIVPAGNKNAALPILAACLLTEEELVVRNVPRIRDVESMLGLLERLGVKVAWTARTRSACRPTPSSAQRSTRSSPIGFAPRSWSRARCWPASGEVKMPPPGGDTIGRRRLDAHLDAFRDMGAKIDGKVWIELSAPPEGLKPRRIFMDEPSVMGTENALLAAALIEGPTTIANAASEPHVQDLARLLCKMGAQVDGIGSNVMTVHGRNRLGGAEHDVCSDHIEVASFMALAAATSGELRIRNVVPEDLEGIRRHFRRLGLQTMLEGNDLLVPPEQKLTIRDDQGDAIPKIDDGPWPAFPADLTSIALALATQADGTIVIHEKMFENRLFFVDKLVAMGARIHLSDPHRAVVSGPSRLHGARLESPDIRAGMAMLIAALAARRHLGDRQRRADRPRLRADRHAPARPRRPHRAGRLRARCQPSCSPRPSTRCEAR